MGAQQVLRAAAVVAAAWCAGSTRVASAAPLPGLPAHTHERVAVVDLGPSSPSIRKQLAEAVVAAGLEPVIGDGIDDALAGQTQDPDAVALASAMERAQRAFGALDCKAARAASVEAIQIAAGRQAGELLVPELPRAYALILLCADRTKDTDAAMLAAARLRVVGSAPPDVDALMMKYPEVDTVSNREMIDVELRADVDGAAIWVDHVKIGSSPVHAQLAAGDHLIAASIRSRRGWAAGTAVASQPVVDVPTADQSTQWSPLSHRIEGWHGHLPAGYELAAVMDETKARVLVIRHGDVLEAWGRIGLKEAPHRLGNEEGLLRVSDADKVMALVVDRARSWNDHAPDPDQPLLVESAQERLMRRAGETHDEPTKWWIYATLIGAAAAGAAIIYAHDKSSDTQRVELHFP